MNTTSTGHATGRKPMGRDELAAHKVIDYGRNHGLSSDGYDDMELAERQGWRTLANWGRDGWDLGEWPYVMIYTQETRGRFDPSASCQACGANLTDGSGDGVNGHWQNCTGEVPREVGRFELMQVCEGDHTVYRFLTEGDREAAIDYMFLWYAAGKDWAPLTWEQRTELDAGTLEVDAKWRGPCQV